MKRALFMSAFALVCVVAVTAQTMPVPTGRDSVGAARRGHRPQYGHEYPELCRTYGSYQPFDAATLAMLYPDHQSYLEKVIADYREPQAGIHRGPRCGGNDS